LKYGHHLRPWTVTTVQAEGDIYVSTMTSNIMRLDSGWTLVTDHGHVGEYGVTGGRLSGTKDRLAATFPRTSRIAISDAGEGRVLGHIMEPPGQLAPSDVAVAEGGVWASRSADNVIRYYDWMGEVQRRVAVPTTSGVARVALSHDESKLAVLTTDGAASILDIASAETLGQLKLREPGRRLSDVTWLVDGRLVVADSASGELLVVGDQNGATPTPTTTPTPSGGATGVCDVTGEKSASPKRGVVGGPAEVRITLDAECPEGSRVAGADIVLLLDVSTSMAPSWHSTAQAIEDFVSRVDGSHHRIGLVTYASSSLVWVPLTADLGELVTRLDEVRCCGGGTRIGEGIVAASDHLLSEGRPDAQHIMILLSDGRAEWGEGITSPADAAAAAKSQGIVVFTVAIGSEANHALLEAVASTAAHATVGRVGIEVVEALRSVVEHVDASLIGRVVIRDELSDDVRYEEDSAQPPAARVDSGLGWYRSVVPREGITVSYRVRLLNPGRIPVNKEAFAEYTDADGERRRHDYEIPFLDVVMPTATPTVTGVPPTSTAESTPVAAYLPLTLKEVCIPTEVHMDVALAIDASWSMLQPEGSGGTKLDAAREAVGLFLDRLDPASDRAAIVAFNADAEVLQGLTADRDRLDLALAAIEPAPQTCLVCAIDVAAAELASVQRSDDVVPVLVLLTDGKSSPRPVGEAVERAAQATNDGVAVFAIGLGDDLDVDALEQIASKPEYYYRAPDAADLNDIYTAIAVTIPCPAADFWGRRP